MSYLIVPFKRWHFYSLADAGSPAGGLFVPDQDTVAAMESAPNIVTLTEDSLPVGAGGTLELWPGRHMAWAILPPISGPHMLAVTREAYKRVRIPPGRIEMTVKRDFDIGHRWAKMLGFELETPVLRGYGPGGVDFTGYVRFNGG
jgi:hypothetical protein